MSASLFGMDAAVLTAIVGMGLATYATRAGGFWLMSHVTLSRRLERFLQQSAGGVLIAIVVAAAMKGDVGMWAGLAAIIGVMLALNRQMLALVIGVAIAIGVRHVLGG
jgi:uncharacterized membrane protein